MISVLNTVQQPNRKLISVKADLQCEQIKTMLKCYGLIFVKVTGPYWNLVTSGSVPYLLLYKSVQSLRMYLSDCVNNPKLLISERQWAAEDVADIPNGHLFMKKLLSGDLEDTLLLDTISVVASGMVRCIDKQLVDFLPGGQFGAMPSEEDLDHTKFAHSTNLSCEHHFGDLDSSQRRRPNASLHHHSSVQMIKRSRVNLMNWFDKMSSNDRSSLLKNARKEGKKLREEHISCEKNVLNEINKDMSTENQKKGRKRKNDIAEEIENEAELINMNDDIQFVKNEYVAVAYQDNWYPGIVHQVSDDSKTLTVHFLAQTKNTGHYIWPTRKDEQQVNPRFILRHGFMPECKNSGRLWFVAEHADITKAYQTFSKVFF
ncbi:hypothetical protein DPMN_085482 [Dreissena polymorpha]|nr:hypothetical protein DPMN_085482 [Dreissena polymorpha]